MLKARPAAHTAAYVAGQQGPSTQASTQQLQGFSEQARKLQQVWRVQSSRSAQVCCFLLVELTASRLRFAGPGKRLILSASL